MRRLISALLLVALAGCATRGDFVRVAELDPAKAALVKEVSVRESIFVGTSRLLKGRVYGPERSEKASFLRYDIAVPKQREAGQVSWPKSAKSADPTTDFLTVADENYPSAEDFRKSLRAEFNRRNQREVIVYVHGYNNTMAESVYRVAQMHHDLKVPGVAVHYAWPSRGSVLGYVYDKDSALFARDALEDLLQEVSAAGAERIQIVAHSMGSFVTMETLRQVFIRNDRNVLRKIDGVMLISPDLDVQLFRSQAIAMKPLPEPFVIFGSTKDTILNLSSRLAGQNDRLGNLSDVSKIADLGVTYLDTAAYSQGAGHFNVATSPALLQLLGGVASLDAAFRAEAAARVGILPGVVLTVREATEIVLLPVGKLAN